MVDSPGQVPMDPNGQPYSVVGITAPPIPDNQTPNGPIPVTTDPVLGGNIQPAAFPQASVSNQGNPESTLTNNNQNIAGQTVVAPVNTEIKPALADQSSGGINTSPADSVIPSDPVLSQPPVVQGADMGANVVSNVNPLAQLATQSMPSVQTDNLNITNQNQIGLPNAVSNANVAGQLKNDVGSGVSSVSQIDNQGVVLQGNKSDVSANGPASGWGSILGNKEAATPTEMKQDVKPVDQIALGTISGKVAGDKITEKPEIVEGLVSGSNINVAKAMSEEAQYLVPQKESVNEDVQEVRKKHPLTDLYQHIEDMTKNSQLMIEQEAEAERRHQTLEQMKDEALGWQLTGKIANILMIFSWVLAGISLLFPYIFKSSKSGSGSSPDFILFIISIMFLLTCTILSFWITTNKKFKTVTWAVFLFFVLIFILIAMKTGGLIGGNVPIISTFLNRFSM